MARKLVLHFEYEDGLDEWELERPWFPNLEPVLCAGGVRRHFDVPHGATKLVLTFSARRLAGGAPFRLTNLWLPHVMATGILGAPPWYAAPSCREEATARGWDGDVRFTDLGEAPRRSQECVESDMVCLLVRHFGQKQCELGLYVAAEYEEPGE